MKEEMVLKCTEKYLCGADDEDKIEWVALYEFRFPWDDYHFSNRRFFVVKHRLMDCEGDYWDRFYNDLRSAMKDFGKEANRKYRLRDGTEEKVYGKVDYCDDWWSYRDELVPACEDDYRSSTNGDYGPGNPWDAPGMSVSDFIKGVY